jgi:choline dehydrogenase-like flavoprotein
MSWDTTADCSSPFPEFDAEVRLNKQRLLSNVRHSCDFVVCGAGSSGWVMAHRTAENVAGKVLLIEASGNNDRPGVSDRSLWPTSLGSLPQSGGWTLAGGISRPKSRGSVRLSGPNPEDPVEIATNALADPDDVKTAIACIEVCREIANAAPLRPFMHREAMPGYLKHPELEHFNRDAATTHWHPSVNAQRKWSRPTIRSDGRAAEQANES